MSDEIILKEVNGEILTSSRDVAERFSKEHRNVMRDIRKIIDDLGGAQNCAHLFTETEYVNTQNKQSYSEYQMTRDGFSLLAMGFTGVEALKWKVKYIDAFNKMEELLKSQNKALPTTYKEALIQLLEVVEKNEQLEVEKQVLLPKATYHDEVLKKDGLLTTTLVAKDLGLPSATKLNQVMYLNKIIYKAQDGVWHPFSKYEWLIANNYADYQSYDKPNSKPCLKWTELGRQWIIHNYEEWLKNIDEVV